jgi:hypothetical protein
MLEIRGLSYKCKPIAYCLLPIAYKLSRKNRGGIDIIRVIVLKIEIV